MFTLPLVSVFVLYSNSQKVILEPYYFQPTLFVKQLKISPLSSAAGPHCRPFGNTADFSKHFQRPTSQSTYFVFVGRAI